MPGNCDARVEELDPMEWPSIAGSFGDHNYENSYSYATTIAAKNNATVKFLCIKSDQALIGAACVRIKNIPLLRRGVAYISGGPLVHDQISTSFNLDRMKTVLAALATRLVKEDRNILMLRLAVTPPAQVADLAEFLTSRGFKETNHVRRYQTIVVNLDQDEAELRSKLHQKWRYHLNQSIKTNMKIESGNDHAFRQRFLAIYESLKQKKDFTSGISPEFFFELDQQDTGTVILLARYGDEYVGGHVLSLLGSTAVYLFGATNDIGREIKAGYLLHWTAMLYARQRGLRWYDLAGFDRVAYPGGYQLKSQTGGYIIEAAGPYQTRPGGWISTILDQALALRRRNSS
jgi:peptidoglycan pentaglycine glycine transferase (the first glycine)